MSFHGGMLGVLARDGAVRALARPAFLEVTDLIAPCVPLGLAAGRIGNFINGELWGRAADPSLPWAMVFPQSGSDGAAPPVAALPVRCSKACCCSCCCGCTRARSDAAPMGQVSGAFLVGYGVLRFVAEYFREPDSFLGLLALGLSMGQWLCVPMVAGRRALWCGRCRCAREPAPRDRRGHRACDRSSSTPRPPA